MKLKRIPIEKLKRGDILIMAPYRRMYKYPISKVIAWTTNTKWTHAAIYLGRGNIIESTHKGVHIDTITYGHYFDDYDWLTLRVKKEYEYAIEPAIEFAKTKMWDGYDYLQASWVGAVYLITKLFKIAIGKYIGYPNKWDVKDRYFCSELVVDAMAHVGVNFSKLLGIDDANIIPEDLLKLDVLTLIEN